LHINYRIIIENTRLIVMKRTVSFKETHGWL